MTVCLHWSKDGVDIPNPESDLAVPDADLSEDTKVPISPTDEAGELEGCPKSECETPDGVKGEKAGEDGLSKLSQFGVIAVASNTPAADTV